MWIYCFGSCSCNRSKWLLTIFIEAEVVDLDSLLRVCGQLGSIITKGAALLTYLLSSQHAFHKGALLLGHHLPVHNLQHNNSQ